MRSVRILYRLVITSVHVNDGRYNPEGESLNLKQNILGADIEIIFRILSAYQMKQPLGFKEFFKRRYNLCSPRISK